MCRIAGIISPSLSIEQLTQQVTLMCDSMVHGGPDDAGVYSNDELHFAFGHRRLALIDLSTKGHQPMFYLEDRYVITFNGEIYNYLELKDELTDRGYEFYTESDTEVILAAFAYWGIQSFEKLNGMFAFALFDKEQNTTYLVRDSSGIKPLYYSISNQQLVFASEVKAFKTITNLSVENEDWKIYILAFGHIPEPFTTLKDVLMLPKSHYLKWNHQSNTAEIECFFEADFTTTITNQKEAVMAINKTLIAAVKRHLIADAPIGVFLSGGIDSSLLTLIANEIQLSAKQALHTVSVNFDDHNLSEKSYQDIIVGQITGVHAEYTINGTLFDQHFSTALKAMDQPTADGINSWFVNYFAKQHGLKAVLSGIGADELFGGYPSFKRMGIVNTISKLPKFLLKQLLLAKSSKIKRFYYLSYKNTIGKYLFLRGLFTPDEISKLLEIDITKVDRTLRQINISSIPQNLQTGEQASWLETNLYMQNQLLKDTDFMSMQHGIEVRVPFLDKELNSLVYTIGNAIKFKKAQPKSLLIDSFIKLLPKEIWDRPKMGFTFPFQDWLKTNQDFQLQLLTCKNQKGKSLIQDFNAGKLHWSKAMAIYYVLAGEK